MRLPRGSGILLHPTSLPGRYGIGDVGPDADRFVGNLTAAGQRWWQMLPVGPTGYGNSPYQSHSSFAGNPLLISPDLLVEDGILSRRDLEPLPDFPTDHVDFDEVTAWKHGLLERAFANFDKTRHDFRGFAWDNGWWLEDFALYMALKEAHGGCAWIDWEPDIARRRPEALEAWRSRLVERVDFHRFVQFLFDRQWRRLRALCRDNGIGLIGDVPIFVALDSSDVWARPELFKLDGHGRPTVVAGVPPDFFSADGQLWGNPLYDWQAHAAEGYRWWIARMRAVINRVDIVRLDHFRGFADYWEIPAGSPTAAGGRWVRGPRDELLHALAEGLNGLPLIAEDLGDIDQAVHDLRDRFDLPGMKILQFAFDGESDGFLPYNYPRNCIVYTGTHDNDTTVGWFTTEESYTIQSPEQVAQERRYVRRFVGPGEPIHWALIRLALSSVADTAVIPLQDVIGLGGEARMNRPGIPAGNWTWRHKSEELTPNLLDRLAELTAVYGRWHGPRLGAFRTVRRESELEATNA